MKIVVASHKRLCDSVNIKRAIKPSENEGKNMKTLVKSTITENGNGLPGIGELVYDSTSDIVYGVAAWDGSDRISTHGPGRGNSVDALLEYVGSAADISDAEWADIESANYGVTCE